MKKLAMLFMTVIFIMAGCEQKQEGQPSEKLVEDKPEVVASEQPKNVRLDLTGEEVEIFKKAVNTSEKLSGVFNMTRPHYQFKIGKDTYLLWISPNSGTIIDIKDTHAAYSLSKESVKGVYAYVKEIQ